MLKDILMTAAVISSCVGILFSSTLWIMSALIGSFAGMFYYGIGMIVSSVTLNIILKRG